MKSLLIEHSLAEITQQIALLLPYKNYPQAKLQLHDLVPIDYFLAKELVDSFKQTLIKNNYSKDEISLFFHLGVAISMSIRSGDSCLPLANLANTRIGFNANEDGIVNTHGFVFPSLDEINTLLSPLAISAQEDKLLVQTDYALYLRRYYQFEQEITDYLVKVKRNDTWVTPFSADLIQSCLEELFSDDTDNEIDWQKIAVANALNKQFSIIAGGPGTGKTYTVTKLLAAIVKLNQEKPLNIALVAPTGKAAQRLTESLINAINGFAGEIDKNILEQIPNQAQTLHRLLGVIPNHVNFRHDQHNLLTIDVLVVDEVSMVDLPMMARLIRALPEHCQLILLGDADQLPSVAVGNILADLAPRPHKGYSKENKNYLSHVTHSKGFKAHANNAFDHVTFLTKSRRFDSQGMVGRLAELVISGQAAESWTLISDVQSSSLLPIEASQWLPKLVKQYYQPLASCSDVSQGFSLLNQFRILCATRVGIEGLDNINEQVEDILYQQGNHSARNQFYHGKPIMITQNDYGLGIFNGDVGLIWTDDKGMLIALFEQPNGEYLRVLPSRLPSFDTVYAMTIHKTQGSEFKHLVMVLPQNKENKILSRELLYTGITRAKKSLQIACTKSTWFQSVDTQVQRFSGIMPFGIKSNKDTN
ncbi:exodeoxyribonuclease V subunit alpha [Thalassotalea piscium]